MMKESSESPLSKMTTQRALSTIAIIILILGLTLIVGAIFYDSYVASFIGVALTFWGMLLFAVTPTRYIHLDFITAASTSSLINTEKLLNEIIPKDKATYLPPKLLDNLKDSLVYIPTKQSKGSLPSYEETRTQQLRTKDGVLLTPPGLGIANYFEEQLGKSFAKMTLLELQRQLPRLLKKLEVTKNLKIIVENTNITVETQINIFDDLHDETKKLPTTLETLGCPFASAIAVIFTRVTGEPITIREEIRTPEAKTTKITYTIVRD
jgi:hypothetical protein